MKKIVFLLSTLFFTALFQSCNSDDEINEIAALEKNFFSIENAIYNDGSFPSATISEMLDGIDMSDQVMNGAMNFITIITEKKIRKFFVGVKGVNGYLEYDPNSNSSSASTLNTYIIPVMMSQNYTGNSTIVLSGQLDNGEVTAPVENQVYYIETMPGAIEVKLAFSNSKDVDLHVITPSGEHIFYDNRGGVYTDEFGDEISYGLDVDSNAGCHIDNINKENIYIPAELVENGVYKVIVDMYSNCQPSIPTSWSIVARYQGELLTPTTGNNPAAGVYQVNAGDGDMTTVMTFTISDGLSSRSEKSNDIRNNWKFTPTQLTKSDIAKINFISE